MKIKKSIKNNKKRKIIEFITKPLKKILIQLFLKVGMNSLQIHKMCFNFNINS